MAKIAILGFGTVGSGVYEVLRRNAASVSRRAGEPVEVKYILDPKDFTGNPVEPLVVKSIDVILQDPEIRVVVETIGGTRFAYPYVKACLVSGRSVCTSNKEMVATYGAELLALAKEHDCAFLFEASVGGGTPIITPMHQCLAANVITEVEGIVNGTTNFMLTKMVRESLGFEDALHIEQELGYDETKSLVWCPRQTSWPEWTTCSTRCWSRAICWAMWCSTARAQASCPPPALWWQTWWMP